MRPGLSRVQSSLVQSGFRLSGSPVSSLANSAFSVQVIAINSTKTSRDSWREGIIRLEQKPSMGGFAYRVYPRLLCQSNRSITHLRLFALPSPLINAYLLRRNLLGTTSILGTTKLFVIAWTKIDTPQNGNRTHVPAFRGDVLSNCTTCVPTRHNKLTPTHS